MKRVALFLLIAALLLVGCSKSTSATAQSHTTDQVNYMQLAVSASDKLSSEQFGDLYAMFDDDLQKNLTENELKWAWAQLLFKMGSFQYYSSDFTVANVNNTMLASIPFTFQSSTIDIHLSFNKQGEISGLYFDSTAANHKISPRLPNDQEIVIGTEPWRLSASLTLPEGEGPFPAVILLQDAGPSDRNEQIGPNLPFYDLANQLSQKGIAVLRYDKRTYTYANEMLALEDMTIVDELLFDAIAAYQQLSAISKIDSQQIYVLGHGFSGMLLPMLHDYLPNAAGYIMLTAPARPAYETLYDQVAYILSLDTTATAENKADILEEVQQTAQNIQNLTPESTLSSDELLGAPVSYWLSLAEYQPLQAVQSIQKPLLLLYGGRDYQVTADDLSLWQQALAHSPNAAFKVYSNLNHLLMTGVGKSNPAEYQTKGTVSEEVSQDIAAFIQQASQNSYN